MSRGLFSQHQGKINRIIMKRLEEAPEMDLGFNLFYQLVA